MPTLRQTKNRIAAVEKIKKIADAMEIVSLTRLRRIEQHTVKARDYFNEIKNLLFSLGKSLIFEAHPALRIHKRIKTIGLVALNSDRGLCGNFNNNIFKKYSDFFSTHRDKSRPLLSDDAFLRSGKGRDKKIIIISIGKKGANFFKNRTGVELIKSFPSSLKQDSLKSAGLVSKTFLDMYVREEIDGLYLLYNQFKLQFLGHAVCERLFPLQSGANPDSTSSMNHVGFTASRSVNPGQSSQTKDYIFEPSPFSVLDSLIKEYIANQIEQAILESNTAEEMARMLAMKQAGDNARELINSLGLIYHKTRQAQITRELMDIISAAEVT
jgi:F-type H+-transporting ATPase subunit gamma